MPCYTKRTPLFILAAAAVMAAGCQKAESPSAGGPAAQSTPPPASSVKSAVPTTFDEVTAQLDAGGDFYAYMDTEQFLSKINSGIGKLHDVVLSGSSDIPDREQVEQAFTLVKDIVAKSGVQEIGGIGSSSVTIAQGLHRNKIFIQHAPDKGTGLIWTLKKGAPHALSGLDFMPANTAAAAVGDFDLAALVNFLKQEAVQSGFPDAKQTVEQWQTQFAGVTGLQLDDVLNSLGNSMGMVLTLDASNTVTFPSQNGGTLTVPSPRLAILLGVKSDVIFNQVDKMAGSNPGVEKTDKPGLKMRTMPLPFSPFPGLTLRPCLASWNGYLILASDDGLVRDMVATLANGGGLKSTPEFTALAAGMPAEGNSFGLCMQSFADAIAKVQAQTMAGQPGASLPQIAALQQFMMQYQNGGHTYAVASNLPNGRIAVMQGSKGTSQVLAPMLIVPAAIAAGVAIPAFEAAQHRSSAARFYHPAAPMQPSQAPVFTPATPGVSGT
jgi:hypothetical protein